MHRSSARFLLSLIVLVGLFGAPSAFALDGDEPFAVVACEKPVTAKAGENVELTFEYQVFKDHFIYRDMSSVSVTDAAGLELKEAVFPKGHVKFDKVSEAEREIFEKTFKVQVSGKVPAGVSGKRDVKVEVKWQGCNKPDNYCLFPETRELTCTVQVGDGATDAGGAAPTEEPEAGADSGDGVVEAVEEPETIHAKGSPEAAVAAGATVKSCDGAAGNAGAGATGIVAWVEGILAGAEGSSFLAFLAIVFLGGLASSLTPCVYPMIPITISVIGASSDQGKLKSFSLALVYVLGISATYTVLGLAAAYSGSLFGGMMQNPWVIVGVSAVFFALAAAMFGFYEFALPSSLTTKASMMGGGGYGGAFVVGTVAGVVAAPCTGPIVALLLVKIASDYTVLQGVAIMLAYSLGLGQIFLVIGTFAGMIGSLPRSGAWMVEVKHVFGVLMVAVGVWYLGQLLEPGVMTALWAGVAVLAAIEAGGRLALFKGPRKPARVGAAAVILLAGLFFALKPAPTVDEAVVADQHVTWGSDHEEGVTLAATAGKPMIVDFTADWCAACKELEHFTYTDPAVVECSAEFVPVMVDGTDKTPEFERLRKHYKVRGLPAVYFVCPEGEVVNELTLKGFEPADSFLTKMNAALTACGGEQASAG